MKTSRGNVYQVSVSPRKPNFSGTKKAKHLVALESDQTHLENKLALLQEQLKRADALSRHYASYYEHAPVGYVTFDDKSLIRDLNIAAENLVGRTREHLVRTPFTLLVARSSSQQFLDHLNRCKQANDQPVVTELKLQTQTGGIIPVQLVSTLFSNDEERLYQTVLVDLTERTTNKTALVQAKDFAESVVETVRQPLLVLDSDLRVISVNRAFSQTFGKNAKLAKGRQFDVLLNLWWSGNRVRDELETVLLKNTRIDDLEVEVDRKDLGRRTFLLNARRLYRKKNLPPQILVAVHDITESKRAAERLRKSEAMLAEAQRLARIGSWEWDISADRVTWSEELFRIYGISSETFKATYAAFLECVHTDDRDRVHKIVQAAYQGRDAFDYYHRTPGAQPIRILHCTGYVVVDQNGTALKMVGTAQDVTELKEAEAHLQRLNADLENRVQVRTRALEQSYKQMEAFCYSIAHDLRAPLRAMKGFSYALIEDYGREVAGEGREYIERIVTAADRMDQLIHDLLNYGRLNTIDLPAERVNLDEVLSQVLSYFKPDLDRLRSRIDVVQSLPDIIGHKLVLELVFRNLIENGLKFVGAGTPPRITIWFKRKTSNIRLYVQDNGIGIAREHQKRIFEVFQRLHSSDTYPGTGIGLAIVTKGIERLGGRVGVVSRPGKGSRFWIELPAA